MKWLLATLILAVAASTAGPGPAPRNVVVILVDDLANDPLDELLQGGWMPRLQSELLDQGVSFQNSFVTNALCCPSRATFLTGRYSHNHAVFANHAGPGTPGIAFDAWFGAGGGPAQEDSTIATALSAAGYHTGFIGKYLNGYGLVAPDGVADPEIYVPPGWSDWQGLIDPTTYRMYGYRMNDNGTVVAYGSAESDYQTDVLSARAVEYIEERAQGSAPFFLVVAPFAPHIEGPQIELDQEGDCSDDLRTIFSFGIRPAPRHTHLADGDPGNGEVPSLPGKPSFNEASVADKPSCPNTPPPCGQVVVAPDCPAELLPLREDVDVPGVELQFVQMAAATLAVDDMIGAIVDALEARGLLENTVVVFSSDNGWFYGEHRLSDKALGYEEAIRVPLVIRAPGGAAGQTSSAVVLNNDLAPTFAELGGVSLAHDADGTSLVPLLEDPAWSDWHRTTFLVEHWFLPSAVSVRFATSFGIRRLAGASDWLYTTWYADPANPAALTHREFYLHSLDPYQQQSVADLLPAHAEASLQSYLQALRTCQGLACRALEAL